MTSLSWNVGSLADHVYNQVDGIPSAVSGTMVELATLAIIRAEGMVNTSLDATNLDDVFIPALKCYTMSQLLGALHAQGAKADTVRLAEFSIKKGDTLQNAAEWWGMRGDDKINTSRGITKGIESNKANG